MFDECLYSHTVECPRHCRHSEYAPPHEPLSSRGTLCRWNVTQDVADHGPGTIPSSGTPLWKDDGVPGIDFDDGYAPRHDDEFGRAALHTLTEVQETFTERGATYGDTWAVGPVYGPADPWQRLSDCAALISVKMRRSLSGGHTHRDSLLDLIAYAAAYVTWADEALAWRA